MQFLIYGTEQDPEKTAPPSPEMKAELGQFMQEAVKAGIVIATGGLQKQGTRVRLSGKIGGAFDETHLAFNDILDLTERFKIKNKKVEIDELIAQLKQTYGGGE